VRVKHNGQPPSGQHQVCVTCGRFDCTGKECELALGDRVFKQKGSEIEHHSGEERGRAHLAEDDGHLRTQTLCCEG